MILEKVSGWNNYTDNIGLLDKDAIEAATEAGQNNIYFEYSTDGSQVSNFDYISLIDSTVNNVTVNTVTGGTVTADLTKAIEGQKITLTVSAADNYTFKSISVKNADNGDVSVTSVTEGTKYTFTMPNSAVTVTAEFEEIPDVDKTGLKTAIDAAITAYNTSEDTLYTTESLTSLKSNIKAAIGVYNNVKAGQEEVTAAQETLANPTNTLVNVYEITKTGDNAEVAITAPQAYTAPTYANTTYTYKDAAENANVGEMTTSSNGHPKVEDEGNLGYTDTDFKVMFKNVGSLDCYETINLPVGGGNGNNAGCKAKVYLTSATTIENMTAENSTVIVDTTVLNNAAKSTGWSDYTDTFIEIDTADVDNSYVNLVVEFTKTNTYCGNMVNLSFSKTPLAVEGFTQLAVPKAMENGKFYAVKDTEVTFTATATDGYSISKVEMNETELTAEESVYKFTMPEANANIAVTTTQD